ncbi:hypothetical protein [Aneurinibacillus tyrosinisolvens]|uniref:hypothetical protein n=1 Tax=Aneurinibacillus tyrosinisolvens TaxID=1443435 RepID=UPI00063F5E22|nr:hypothetical protein [Aneurinibacillus tyrosinisolvens]
MKKKVSPNRRKELPIINQRLSGIENTLHEQLLEIKNTLHEIEGHVRETKNNREKIENILVELAEVKQHLAERNNRWPRKRRDKGEAEAATTPNGTKTSKNDGFLENLISSIDFAQIMKLLQSPMVQSMLKNIL